MFPFQMYILYQNLQSRKSVQFRMPQLSGQNFSLRFEFCLNNVKGYCREGRQARVELVKILVQ